MKKLTSICAIAISILICGYAPNTFARTYSELGCGADYAPTREVQPVYPLRAQQMGIEGYIVMGFTIDTDGKVSDISVIDAHPANAFVRSATRAVESLKFPPCVIGGKVTQQASVSIKYAFKLQRH